LISLPTKHCHPNNDDAETETADADRTPLDSTSVHTEVNDAAPGTPSSVRRPRTEVVPSVWNCWQYQRFCNVPSPDELPLSVARPSDLPLRSVKLFVSRLSLYTTPRPVKKHLCSTLNATSDILLLTNLILTPRVKYSFKIFFQTVSY